MPSLATCGCRKLRRSLWRAAGRVRIVAPAVPGRRSTCVSWWCGWRARTRAAGTGGSKANSSGSASLSLPAPAWEILRREGIEPAPRRLESSWAEFLCWQAASILECDFLTVDTVFFKRLYIWFFIELASRRVYLAGISANPDGAWVTQQARNLLMRLDDEGLRPRFLVRDRDSKFTRDFDQVFRSEGIGVIKAPVRAPRARAHAERWVASLRRERLDRLLILRRRHLERVVHAYAMHYNAHRPHARSASSRRSPSRRRLANPRR